MKAILLALCLGLAPFLCVPACAAPEASLPVLVSLAPQKYMLERIAGDAVRVSVMVKPGSDPHTFEPGPSQMRAAAEARIWFTMGIPFETAWKDRIAGAAGRLALVSCIRDITRMGSGGEPCDEDHHDHHAHSHGGEDPHVWLSPLLAADMLPVITEALARAVPEKEALFAANAMAFAKELRALHQELSARFSAFPREKRVFLTFHPSWRYYARDFGLTELSVEVGGKEPGPKAMKTILDTARKHGIRTIFIEPQFSSAAARAIAGELGAGIRTLDPLAQDLPRLYKEVAGALMDSFEPAPVPAP